MNSFCPTHKNRIGKIIPTMTKALAYFTKFKMEQQGLKIANNCLNTNIYPYLETFGGQSYNLYLNVVHFFNANVN